MPLLSITTTKRAILLSRVLALFFASNSFSLCLSVHLFSFLIFFVFIRDPYATNFAVLSSPLFVRAVRSLVCHLSVSSDYTVICIRANLAMVTTLFQGSLSSSVSLYSLRPRHLLESPSGVKLASLRSAINRRARNGAQPRDA
jgi:hypothetical protein